MIYPEKLSCLCLELKNIHLVTVDETQTKSRDTNRCTTIKSLSLNIAFQTRIRFRKMGFTFSNKILHEKYNFKVEIKGTIACTFLEIHNLLQSILNLNPTCA